MMKKSLFSIYLSKSCALRNSFILFAVFLFSPFMAAEVLYSRIVVSGDAEIITVSGREQASNHTSEIASVRPENSKINPWEDRKVASKKEAPAAKIAVSASSESVQNFPVQESGTFVMMMTYKASDSVTSENTVAIVPLHKILMNGVSHLYSRINEALLSAFAFLFTNRYTCRSPPLFV